MTSVASGETLTSRAVFTEPVYYLVEFTLDGTVPETGGRYPFTPTRPENADWQYLSGVVFENGEFSWQATVTENSGSFSDDDSM